MGAGNNARTVIRGSDRRDIRNRYIGQARDRNGRWTGNNRQDLIIYGNELRAFCHVAASIRGTVGRRVGDWAGTRADIPYMGDGNNARTVIRGSDRRDIRNRYIGQARDRNGRWTGNNRQDLIIYGNELRAFCHVAASIRGTVGTRDGDGAGTRAALPYRGDGKNARAVIRGSDRRDIRNRYIGQARDRNGRWTGNNRQDLIIYGNELRAFCHVAASIRGTVGTRDGDWAGTRADIPYMGDGNNARTVIRGSDRRDIRNRYIGQARDRNGRWTGNNRQDLIIYGNELRAFCHVAASIRGTVGRRDGDWAGTRAAIPYMGDGNNGRTVIRGSDRRDIRNRYIGQARDRNVRWTGNNRQDLIIYGNELRAFCHVAASIRGTVGTRDGEWAGTRADITYMGDGNNAAAVIRGSDRRDIRNRYRSEERGVWNEWRSRWSQY